MIEGPPKKKTTELRERYAFLFKDEKFNDKVTQEYAKQKHLHDRDLLFMKAHAEILDMFEYYALAGKPFPPLNFFLQAYSSHQKGFFDFYNPKLFNKSGNAKIQTFFDRLNMARKNVVAMLNDTKNRGHIHFFNRLAIVDKIHQHIFKRMEAQSPLCMPYIFNLLTINKFNFLSLAESKTVVEDNIAQLRYYLCNEMLIDCYHFQDQDKESAFVSVFSKKPKPKTGKELKDEFVQNLTHIFRALEIYLPKLLTSANNFSEFEYKQVKKKVDEFESRKNKKSKKRKK